MLKSRSTSFNILLKGWYFHTLGSHQLSLKNNVTDWVKDKARADLTWWSVLGVINQCGALFLDINWHCNFRYLRQSGLFWLFGYCISLFKISPHVNLSQRTQFSRRLLYYNWYFTGVVSTTVSCSALGQTQRQIAVSSPSNWGKKQHQTQYQLL